MRDILHFECQRNGKTIKAVTERGNFIYQGAFSDIEERMKLPFSTRRKMAFKEKLQEFFHNPFG